VHRRSLWIDTLAHLPSITPLPNDAFQPRKVELEKSLHALLQRLWKMSRIRRQRSTKWHQATAQAGYKKVAVRLSFDLVLIRRSANFASSS
jgi:hypothetical protein